jgi:hypothetical protein
MKLTRKKESFLAYLRWIETTNYVMKRKSITKWKKLILRLFFAVLVKYERNHIYSMLRLNEIIHCVSFVIWIKKKREESLFVEISNENINKMINHRINRIFDEKTSHRIKFNNHFHVFILFNKSIIVVSFFSAFFTTKVNTSSIESISSISILSALKRHFELRYRFNVFDFLNLLIMR